MYLAGYLERKGYRSEIVDITLKEQVRTRGFLKNKSKILEEVEKKIIEEVKKLKPDIIGITCYSPEYFEVLKLAEKIKKINKEIKIIVGGIHPTLYPNDFCYSSSPFDVAVIGEGELTLLELVKVLRWGGKIEKVDGIAFWNKRGGRIVITPKRQLCQDLDEISFPAYDKIDMNYYTTASPYAIRGVFLRSMYILYSRGCPSQCTFCVAKKLRTCNGAGNYVRLRDPQKVFKEILFLKDRYQIDSFYFIDDLFTLDKQKVKQFCQLIINSKLNLLWGCSSKVTTVDYETLRIMKKAGCIQIDFGVERGSDRALSLIKKGITVRLVKKIFRYCHRLGIRTFANMLINIPGEEEKDLEDIINLVKKIKPTIVSFNTFVPYPGTEIFDQFSTSFSPRDYPLMMEDPGMLTRKYASKFRFANHRVDFQRWASFYHRKFNKVILNLKIYFSLSYVFLLLRSKRKLNYFKQLGLLFKEFVNQKFL